MYANPVRVMASGAIDVNHKDEVYDGKVPDIIDNAFVIVEFGNGCRGMLDLCMFAEGSKNEQEISVVGDTGKVQPDAFTILVVHQTLMCVYKFFENVEHVFFSKK